MSARRHSLRSLGFGFGLTLAALAGARPSTGAGRPGEAADAPVLAVEAAGIRLPEGFTATVFAGGVGPGRHIVVRENGDVYLALRQPAGGKGVVGLRDADGDGRADETARFGATGGTGIAIHDGYLYFSSDVAVFRAKLDAKALAPTRSVETVASDFPQQSAHAAKSIALDDAENPQSAQHRPTGIAEGPDGSLYVSDSVKGRIWRIRYTGDGVDDAAKGEAE